MSHAYNGVNGTFLPGTYTGPGPDSPTPTRQIPNAERQAVGLETTADPYDFGDGSGPITHNPTALSENGLRAEMGLELRPSYARSEEHTSELQSLMRTSYAVFCLKKK